MPASTSPPRRSRAWNAPQLVPCTRPSLGLIFHFFPFSPLLVPRLRPTWNANSLNRILCLLLCFSRAVLQQLRTLCLFFFFFSFFFFPLLFSYIPAIFLNLYRHSLLCFSRVFPFFLLYFICARWHRTLLLPSNPTRYIGYLSSQPLARIPLGLFLFWAPARSYGCAALRHSPL